MIRSAAAILVAGIAAISFASAGKDVVLLDADLGLANADVLCKHGKASHVHTA